MKDVSAKEARRRADQSRRDLGRPSGSPIRSRRRLRKLGIGINSCYVAAKSGQIPAIKIGDRILVPRVALEAMLAKAGE